MHGQRLGAAQRLGQALAVDLHGALAVADEQPLASGWGCHGVSLWRGRAHDAALAPNVASWAANCLRSLYSGFLPLCSGGRKASHGPGVVHFAGRGDRPRQIDHPWQEYAWRPVSVFLNAPEVGEWRELRRDATSTHYHAATLPLELHPKETIGYRGQPRRRQAAGLRRAAARRRQRPSPSRSALVTASPYDAEVYGYDVATRSSGRCHARAADRAVEAFVAEHHVEEPFVKRQRQKHHREEEHKFGQEPIAGAAPAQRPRREASDE